MKEGFVSSVLDDVRVKKENLELTTLNTYYKGSRGESVVFFFFTGMKYRMDKPPPSPPPPCRAQKISREKLFHFFTSFVICNRIFIRPVRPGQDVAIIGNSSPTRCKRSLRFNIRLCKLFSEFS